MKNYLLLYFVLGLFSITQIFAVDNSPAQESAGARNPADLQVRDAAPADLDKINELLRLSRAVWGYSDQLLDAFMQVLGVSYGYLEKHTCKVAYLEDRLIGFYSFGFFEDGRPELDKFFVDADLVRQGLGRILYHDCLATAKKLGISEFVVWSNPHAEGFYLKMGCEKVGEKQSPLEPEIFPPILACKTPE